MAEVVTAVYVNGAFVPEQAPSISAGSRVRLVVEPIRAADDQIAIDEFDAICDSIVVNGSLPRMTRDELHERD